MARWRSQPLPKFRMRRVTVKVFIARRKVGLGGAAFRTHLHYIERDGVDRNGAPGRLYDRASDDVDGDDFRARSDKDRRQFRLIVSPEDGSAFSDLKENTRSLMARVEADLGRKLDWVAVDHFDTGHPHTHVVIRGRDFAGEDLIIARDYLIQGLRQRAAEVMTERLGPRRDLEILQSRSAEVDRNRFTGIDRDLAARAREDAIRLTTGATARDRFERDIALRRLRHLETLSLAMCAGPDIWRLAPEWEGALRTLGRRDDIVRTLTAQIGDRARTPLFEIYKPATGKTITGRIAAFGAADEIGENRFLVVEATDGRSWYVELGAVSGESLPGKGAIVEIAPHNAGPQTADLTIARIARTNAWLYSDALHRNDDPY